MLIVQAFKFIFTSPTSAHDVSCENDIQDHARPVSNRSRSRKAPTRGNVARLLGMRSVTPRSIAYVAVQLRYALSSAAAWNENDGSFCYPVFYNHIVDFFENPPGAAAQAHVQSLLSWWTKCAIPSSSSHLTLLTCNRKVFGDHRIPMQVTSHPGSSVARLASQLAARETTNRR
jgi:hypothetical protein